MHFLLLLFLIGSLVREGQGALQGAQHRRPAPAVGSSVCFPGPPGPAIANNKFVQKTQMPIKGSPCRKPTGGTWCRQRMSTQVLQPLHLTWLSAPERLHRVVTSRRGCHQGERNRGKNDRLAGTGSNGRNTRLIEVARKEERWSNAGARPGRGTTWRWKIRICGSWSSVSFTSSIKSRRKSKRDATVRTH